MFDGVSKGVGGGIPPLDSDIASMQDGYLPRYSVNSLSDIISTDGIVESPIAALLRVVSFIPRLRGGANHQDPPGSMQQA